MLPACRTAGDLYAIPQFALESRDVEGFLDELHNFHAAFRACFGRSELREHFWRYMVGQWSTLERKSKLSGNFRGSQLPDFPSKQGVSCQVQMDTSEQMLDVQDTIATPLDDFDLVVLLQGLFAKFEAG